MRVVFDAVTASLNSYTTKQALLTRTPNASAGLESLQEEDEESSVPAGRRASDRLKASRKEVAAPVINLLEKIVEDRSTELAQICRSGHTLELAIMFCKSLLEIPTYRYNMIHTCW